MSMIQCFSPLAAPDARLLILGSMPGVASLDAGEYYAHPRNLFWRLLGEVLGVALTELPYAQRWPVLQAHGIALWDVLASCERQGSLDSAIAADTIRANDFATFFRRQPVLRHVFFNGSLAERAFRRHVLPQLSGTSLALQRLPSSSPAHAALGFAEKLACWQAALQLLVRELP